MTARPRLPEDYELPEEVNGWVHTTDSNRNAHVWTAPEAEKSVGAFANVGSAYAKVFDDRASGFKHGVELHRTEDDDPIEGVTETIAKATDWMERHAPEDWTHPDVVEAVFDPPVGHVLVRYFIEQRDTEVWYRREDAEGGFRLAGAGEPESYTPESCPYLLVHVWNGSGNATVAIAPWLRAHGPGSKYEEIRRVAKPPEECGLEVALKYAREYAAEVTGETLETPAPGQSGLADFGGAPT